jgi:putative ABC transport system permease protein
MTAPRARPRFSTLLLGTFAAITLLLAAVGIYAVVAATVRQRTREIGIRIALGAKAGEVQALVLRRGIQVALWGCAIGIAAAFFGTRILRSLLFGISPTDPMTFVVVAGLILGVTALACYLPARRAAGWIRWRRYGRTEWHSAPRRDLAYCIGMMPINGPYPILSVVLSIEPGRSRH